MIRSLSISAFFILLISACGNNDSSEEYAMDEYQIIITTPMREQAQTAHSTEELNAAISRIEEWHENNNTKFSGLLNQGLSDGEIDAYFAPLGCFPPTELQELWRWRNGQSETADGAVMVWYHRLLPIEEAIQEYNFLLEEPLTGWNPNWIPVFYFQEEWYFVECQKKQVSASPLMYFFTEYGFSHPYTNITTYLLTAAEAMEAGAVYVDAEGYMESKINELVAIHRKYNPGLEFPYAVEE